MEPTTDMTHPEFKERRAPRWRVVFYSGVENPCRSQGIPSVRNTLDRVVLTIRS